MSIMSIMFSLFRNALATACIVVSAVSFSFYIAPVSAGDTGKNAKYTQVDDKPAKAPVNINTADALTLSANLTGVGVKRAEAIVAFRNANGKFKSVDQLAQVKGIGAAVLEKNRARIKL